jgi:branched-chain amino acid transport system substrate-binding protein
MKYLLLTAAILGLSLTACTKKNDNEIVLGHFASMTGSEATFGISTDEGLRLAFEEVNAAGGVKGKKIRLITMDDQGKPEEAAAVATRLIEQEKVLALIGEVASSRSLAVAPLAQAKKVPMISPSSTNPKVTEVGNYIFRTCFIDPFQGTVMAKFAFETQKYKKVAILRDVKSDYSVGLADFFASKFKDLGGEIVADVSYQAGDVDFKAQLTKIKSLKPEAIMIPGYYTEVGLIARQARELGYKGTFLGGDGWDSPKLSEIGQSAIDGGYFSNHFSNESTEPTAVEFMKKFQAKYNKTPDGLSSVAYDAAKIIIHALESAPEISRDSLRDELAKIKDFQGATGKITIDGNRNATKSAVVVQVKGKANKFVTTVNP